MLRPMGIVRRTVASNPRWKTGRRRLYQERFRAMDLPCSICNRPIDYSLPYYVTDAHGRKHVNMLAFVIDEKIPVSKWREGGYNSAIDCANDFNNLAPAHAICNAMKGNKENFSIVAYSKKKNIQGDMTKQSVTQQKRKLIPIDGDW